MEFVLVTGPRPGVTLVTLNRPAKRNALSIALMGELAAVLDQAAADDGVRSVVITGDERAFSAGADINDQLERGLDAVFSDERLDAWRTVERFPKPLVAAVEGYALGGGCELAMLADIVIAGETARFGQPEINIGIFPGDGATQRLARSVGKSMAMKMVLSGEMIDAAEAKAIGLVAEVAAAGKTVGRALDLAAVIAEKSPIALRLAKEAVLTAFETPLSAGLEFERRNLALAFDSDDQKEGMRAFVEKRKPRFGGT
ncbi:MAG: enoyl-CoA hydratase-related protein [Rhodospirillales bacterium]|jgi:enoyl-CoA hydratase|nr:enoyl-CoA hydratase-related protein [Rhodospirillales bacterium]MDP6882595.1 enoyl-CoA hydratase-related protein [Rhodospirillales bacterium]